MRLLFLTVSRLRGQGGKEGAIQLISRGLEERGHAVSVAFAGPSEDRVWEASLPNLHVGPLPATWRAARERPIAVLRYIARCVRSVQPDVVIATEPGGVVLLRAACALARLPRPRVMSWLHGDVARNRFPQALRWCDGHMAISRGIAEQLQAVARAGAPVATVYNPVRDPGALIPRPPRGTPPVFVFCGRVEPQKRVDRLFRILADARAYAWRLELVGDGALRPQMEALAAEVGIAERVIWHGWLPDPWMVISEATAFLMTSDSEGFPLVLLEAGIRGIPALAMDCRFGPSEIIESGRNGWLVPLGADADFGAVLKGLCGGALLPPPPDVVSAGTERFRRPAVLDVVEAALRRVADGAARVRT